MTYDDPTENGLLSPKEDNSVLFGLEDEDAPKKAILLDGKLPEAADDKNPSDTKDSTSGGISHEAKIAKLDKDLATQVKVLTALQHAQQLVKAADERLPVARPECPVSKLQILELSDCIFEKACIHESIIWRIRADKLLGDDATTFDTEHEGVIWEAVDMYKQSIITARERALKCEAVSSSRLGRVFEKYLKGKMRARFYYHHAISIVLTDTQHGWRQTSWYKEAWQGLQRLQGDQVLEEDQILVVERTIYEEKLTIITTTLEAEKNKSPASFLKYIYTEYPPKNAEHKLDEATLASDLIRSLKDASCHYSRDQQPKGKDEDARFWFFVAEEISKIVNALYQERKPRGPSRSSSPVPKK
jgi:hypothetical protein